MYRRPLLRHGIRRARRTFYLRRRRGCCCLGPVLLLLVPLIALAALRLL
jgi:hypothetical protein